MSNTSTELEVTPSLDLLKDTSHINALESFENRFDSKIKQAKIYPNWAVVVFIVGILFGVVSFLFVIFKKIEDVVEFYFFLIA